MMVLPKPPIAKVVWVDWILAILKRPIVTIWFMLDLVDKLFISSENKCFTCYFLGWYECLFSPRLET